MPDAAAPGGDRRPSPRPTRTSCRSACSRLVAEDPTLRLERNAETHQLVLWCMGEAHVDVLLDRLRNRYGVAVDVRGRCGSRCARRSPARPRATAGTSSSPAGTGSTRSATSRSSRCPRAPASSSSTRWSAARCRASSSRRSRRACAPRWSAGVVAGYPVVDIRVTLVDGKAHSVDSSDMAFQMAGALALKEAAAAGADARCSSRSTQIGVLVADEYVGAVMSDLSGRRGRVSGTEPVGAGRTLVRAEVPQLELTRYAIDLRSLSHGTGHLHPHLRRGTSRCPPTWRPRSRPRPPPPPDRMKVPFCAHCRSNPPFIASEAAGSRRS